jgi:hypothetical protein
LFFVVKKVELWPQFYEVPKLPFKFYPMKNFSVLFFFLLPFFASAQMLTGIATYFDDSFREWILFTEYEGEEGELELRWEDNWSEWDYRLGEDFGTIKLKWRDKPDEWELRGNNKVVTARTLWRGDFREWRITDNSVTLTLRSRFSNQMDEWELRSSNHGEYRMVTNWERDPRDWIIEDGLDDEVSFEMRMMLAFIVVFHSSPKQ